MGDRRMPGLGRVGGWLTAVLLGVGLLSLTSCSAFVDRDQPGATPGYAVRLEPGHPVGRTFVVRHGGLNGVEVWLEPEPGARGELRLHLRDDPQATDDLAVSVLPLAQVAAAGFYRFPLPPLPDAHGRYCYAFLQMEGVGAVAVGAGPGDAYLDGALYRDHQPQDAQMAFRLVYDPRWMLLDLGGAAVGALGLLAVAGLLYMVPGWALLAWLWPGKRLSWAERLGVACGLSLALYPLLFLWTDLVGLHLGPLYAWLPAAAGLAALAWRYRDWRPREGRDALRQWACSEALWPDLVLLAVVGLVFGVRLLVVRTLDAPLWGDSYQHTVIAQLLVDHGGLFDSWEPYAPLQTFTYHFGFHAAAAVFHWLTGLETVRAVIWVGQLLNGLAVLALYPLAVRVSGNRWAGVGAVLVAGLLSPMPMFYVNWGRYTQLAGQVILPAAVLVTWSALEALRRDWQLIVLGWITVGGLALTHYRVLIFYIVFILAWVLLALRRATWRRTLARATWLGTGVAVLFLPWFIHAFAGRIVRNFARQLTTAPGQLSSFARQYNAIGDLALYLAPVGWLLLAVAVAAGLWRRRRGVLLMSLWWFLLLIATNPDWLRLPGSGAISNFALFIAAYIPAGVLIGDLFSRLVARLEPRGWFSALAALLVMGIGLGGTRVRVGDVRVSQHALVTRPDLRVMVWVRENTPEDARLLVNSFFAYGGSVVVGSDGGWWLPLLAERANTVPPLNYGTEQGPWPEYSEWVNELTSQVQVAGIDDPATLALLREWGVTHVYIGQRQGRVNYEGPDVLDPEALLRSDHYKLVYRQDRVWVFEVVW
ncbi:MAG TPA: hypothetical protein ENI39_04475 [Anaerolineae bacterium]|nr:hypothetical protein [Anaerolineae bacterium]